MKTFSEKKMKLSASELRSKGLDPVEAAICLPRSSSATMIALVHSCTHQPAHVKSSAATSEDSENALQAARVPPRPSARGCWSCSISRLDRQILVHSEPCQMVVAGFEPRA